jgi:hypothetical protein
MRKAINNASEHYTHEEREIINNRVLQTIKKH